MSSFTIREVHPWISFPAAPQNATQIIIGSFPPKRFTYPKNDLDIDYDVPKRTLRKDDVNFFYGSVDNSFLNLLAEELDLNYDIPADIELLKQYLDENGWIITDIVLEATRNPKRPNSASDTDLRVITWNKEAIQRLFEENQIKTIFFTSNWVKKHFFKHVIDASDPYVSDCAVHTLISPSPQGLRSLKWAYGVLPIKVGESTTDYRKRYYQTVLLNALQPDNEYQYTIKVGDKVVGTFTYRGLRDVRFYNDDWVMRSDAKEWKQVIEYVELHSLMDINPPPPKHYWLE